MPRPLFFFCLGASLLTVGCVPKPVAPPLPSRPGQVLFEHHCASCHGLDAGGSGPAATALNPPPPDLTRIAARRGGQFPALEIAAIIDGRRALIAHGSRAMPVWGERYGAGQEPGPMREEQVTGNLLALVDYLESLQKP